MKAIYVLKALGVALCIAVASSAYAQSASAPASANVQTTVTKKINRKLGLDVRRALSKTNDINVSNIFVRARGGAVTLTGSVPDGAQIPRAEEVAKGVSGVTSVTNKLSLAPQNGS